MKADLWGEVVWGAAEGPDGGVAVLCEAKVCDLDVAVKVEEDVFWLEVAVNDVEAVEVVECEGDLCCVEFGDWIWKPL